MIPSFIVQQCYYNILQSLKMHLLNGPTEEQMQKIATELNENEERFAHNLDLLKTWITYQDHLPKNYDSRILPVFLRGCKHDLERTKRKIELYYSVRKTIPELYANRDTTSEDAIIAAKTMAMCPMSILNHDGCRVTFIKLTTNDPAVYKMEHIVRLFIMLGDIRVCEETPIAGDIFVMDLSNNLTACHVARVASTIVSKGLAVAQEAYPQRLKQIHVLNQPDYAEKVLNFLKSFMKEKMRNRFIIHKTTDTLHDYLSPEVLPKEYGGSAGDLIKLQQKWQKYLQEKKDWFKEQENIAATGPIPKHLSYSCAFDSNESIQGSFRKLAID